ncbi:MAG: hypothetical protein RIS70_2242 [Planctomycetota bacterium]|jgi:hypothetical protein
MLTKRIRHVSRLTILLLPACFVMLAGCRTVPDCNSGDLQSNRVLSERSDYLVADELCEQTDPQIERGEPRPLLDGVARIVGIPSRVILWDRRIDNHNVSLTTEAVIAEYLDRNELDTVKVRVNQYAPGDEWRRLVANKRVGWGWRYTAGTLSWLQDTILPGRLFGGDHFNPFTNTIYLYSDVPAVALHEAAHAKDFARRRYKGTYAVAYTLPGVPLWHEAIASRDALAYVRAYRSPDEEREAYRILFPAYGTYVGNAAAQVLPWNSTLVYAGAVIPGHVLGRWRARHVAEERHELEFVPMEADAP